MANTKGNVQKLIGHIHKSNTVVEEQQQLVATPNAGQNILDMDGLSTDKTLATIEYVKKTEDQIDAKVKVAGVFKSTPQAIASKLTNNFDVVDKIVDTTIPPTAGQASDTQIPTALAVDKYVTAKVGNGTTQLKADMVKAQADILANHGVIEVNKGTLAANSNHLLNIQHDLSSAQSSITTLKGDMTTAKNNITNNEVVLTQFGTQLHQTEANVGNLNTQVASISQIATDAKASVTAEAQRSQTEDLTHSRDLALAKRDIDTLKSLGGFQGVYNTETDRDNAYAPNSEKDGDYVLIATASTTHPGTYGAPYSIQRYNGNTHVWDDKGEIDTPLDLTAFAKTADMVAADQQIKTRIDTQVVPLITANTGDIGSLKTVVGKDDDTATGGTAATGLILKANENQQGVTDNKAELVTQKADYTQKVTDAITQAKTYTDTEISNKLDDLLPLYEFLPSDESFGKYYTWYAAHAAKLVHGDSFVGKLKTLVETYVVDFKDIGATWVDANGSRALQTVTNLPTPDNLSDTSNSAIKMEVISFPMLNSIGDNALPNSGGGIVGEQYVLEVINKQALFEGGKPELNYTYKTNYDNWAAPAGTTKTEQEYLKVFPDHAIRATKWEKARTKVKINFAEKGVI